MKDVKSLWALNCCLMCSGSTYTNWICHTVQWPTEFCAVNIFAVPTQFFLVILCGITNSRHVFEAVATLFIYNREPPWLMTVALALYHLHWLCCPCYLPYSRKSSLNISPTVCYFYETHQSRGGCICKR